VLIACWSAKGGTGTTVVTTALALLLARARGRAVVADLGGDVPLALGLDGAPPPGARGIAEWLQQAPHVAPDAIGRLLEPVEPGRLWLLRRGQGELSPAGADLLASVLAADDRPVVADCGRIDGDSAGSAVASILAAGATRSLLVVRPCFLALHRAAAAPIRPTGVVLLREEGRAIAPADVEHALGVPVVANVRVTDQIARSVDAGLLRAHLPRTLAKDLAHAA
jgi:hypothetical protein